MAESKEEKLRLWREYDNEPYLPGYTRGEFNRLPPRKKSRELQKLTQRVTSYLGYWKTCDVPACRRARACRGFLSEKQYRDYHDAFPPCVGPNGARQPEVLAAFPAALGYPPEEDEGPKYNGRAFQSAGGGWGGLVTAACLPKTRPSPRLRGGSR